MFTKEERLFIWKKVYEMIDRLEDGEYICVALRNVVFMYFKTHKNIYEFRSDEMVRIYFPELEEKISMATEPEETRTFYGWFGCLSPETKEVRLNIVKDIIHRGDDAACRCVCAGPGSILGISQTIKQKSYENI